MGAALSGNEHVPHQAACRNTAQVFREAVPPDQPLEGHLCLSHRLHKLMKALGISALNFFFLTGEGRGRTARRGSRMSRKKG